MQTSTIAIVTVQPEADRQGGRLRTGPGCICEGSGPTVSQGANLNGRVRGEKRSILLIGKTRKRKLPCAEFVYVILFTAPEN